MRLTLMGISRSHIATADSFLIMYQAVEHLMPSPSRNHRLQYKFRNGRDSREVGADVTQKLCKSQCRRGRLQQASKHVSKFAICAQHAGQHREFDQTPVLPSSFFPLTALSPYRPLSKGPSTRLPTNSNSGSCPKLVRRVLDPLPATTVRLNCGAYHYLSMPRDAPGLLQ